MTNELKNALAIANGLQEERRVELIREKVAEQYSDKADEIAILRKELADLKALVKQLHKDELPTSEFDEYNAKIEEIKESVKQELNI